MLKNERKRKDKIIIISIFLLTLLLSCGKEQNKPIKVNIKIHKKKTAKVKKITKKEKSTKNFINKKFTYKIQDIKRDPFTPFIQLQEKEAKALLPKNVVVTPLTEYSLDQYRLVGIMTDAKPPLAMVETNDRKGLIFSVGDYIGSEYYKVIKITSDQIVLQKRYLTYDKKIKIEKKVLKIDISGE